jgi:hypothetical protein
MANGYQNDLLIVDTVDYDFRKIQWVPREIEYSPDSDFVAISSPGRNNSFFHFGGSDDTITLELDWYATQDNREDVLANCRWLESKTKNHSQKEGVHPVLFHFGNIFYGQNEESEVFLITSAKYTLGSFSRPHQMYPTQAKQTLVLKRITSNQRTHDEIKYVEATYALDPNKDPDALGRVFQNTNQLISESQVLKNQNKAKLDEEIAKFQASNQSLRYMKTKFFLQRGSQIAINAAQYFANQTVHKALDRAGKTAAEIQTLGDDFNKQQR